MEKKRSSPSRRDGRKSEYEQENAFYRNDHENDALCGPVLDKRWNEQHRQNIKDNNQVKGGRKARGRLWNPDHARHPIQQKYPGQ